MLFAALVAVELAALVLAVALGRASGFRASSERAKREAFAPLVALFAFAVANDVAIELLHLALAGAAKPFAGWHRVAYHVETALVLGWPASLAAAAWRAFGGHAGQVFGTPSSSPMQRHGGGWPGARQQAPPQSSGAPHVASEIGSAPVVSWSVGASLSSRPKSSFMGRLLEVAIVVLGTVVAGLAWALTVVWQRAARAEHAKELWREVAFRNGRRVAALERGRAQAARMLRALSDVLADR